MSKELKHLTLEQIKEVLISGDFDRFLGVNEDEHFEAKPQFPYDLKTGDLKAIMSLCTDIAQFANKSEAYIICGLDSERENPTLPHDIIKTINPMEEKIFMEAYKNVPSIVRANVHPNPSDIEVLWYPYKNDPSRGLGVIHIPEQLDERRFFIVEVHGEEKLNVGNTFFGIPVRNGEDKTWKKKEEIYKLTKNAPRNIKDLDDMIAKRFDRLEEKIEKTKATRTIDSKAKVLKIIEEVLNDK